MNEQALWANRIRPWLASLEHAGAPIWWAKNHGSAFSRDRLDVEVAIVGRMLAVELKNPEDDEIEPTRGQAREIKRYTKARVPTFVSNNELAVKGFISRALQLYADWRHPKLTEPYLL